MWPANATTLFIETNQEQGHPLKNPRLEHILQHVLFSFRGELIHSSVHPRGCTADHRCHPGFLQPSVGLLSKWQVNLTRLPEDISLHCVILCEGPRLLSGSSLCMTNERSSGRGEMTSLSGADRLTGACVSQRARAIKERAFLRLAQSRSHIAMTTLSDDP